MTTPILTPIVVDKHLGAMLKILNTLSEKKDKIDKHLSKHLRIMGIFYI